MHTIAWQVVSHSANVNLICVGCQLRSIRDFRMQEPENDFIDKVETPPSTNEPPPPTRRRWFRPIAGGILFLIILFYMIDLVHWLVVQNNLANWEATISRDEAGIRADCASYSIGPEHSNTAVLLVHGINASPQAFYKLAPRLSNSQWFCRCLRLPGFGEPVPAYAKATIENWVESLDNEIMDLKKRHQHVFIVAHSLGAAVTIRCMIEKQNSQFVDGLILAAPAIQVSSRRSPILPTEFWHTTLGAMLVFTHNLQSPFGEDALDPNERTSPFRTPFTPLRVANRTFDLIRQNKGNAHQLDLPVLMCLAQQDSVIDNLAAEEFFHQLPHSDNRIIVFKNSAHAILVDYQWEDLATSITTFIESRLPPLQPLQRPSLERSE